MTSNYPDDYDEDEDDDEWMYSSGVPESNYDDADIHEDVTSSGFEKPETYQDWLNIIEDKYFEERDDLIRQTLQTAFNAVDSPYSFLVHVMHRAFFDLYSKRVPITFYALDEMSNWLNLKMVNKELIPEPTESNKRHAGEFVCRSGYNYLDKINSIFRLDQGDCDFISEFVQLDNLKSKKLKETVTIIYTLKLQHCFDGARIYLPLLANDQLQHIEKFVGEDVKLQTEYVGFLDNLCSMEPTDIENMVMEQDLVCKDPSKLKYKTIIKIAEKAVKRYALNPDDFPNIFGAKNINSLFYLIKMRLSEARSGSSRSKLQKWDDLIESSVKDKLWLQLKLIDRLIDLNEIEGAVVWAKKLAIPLNKLPHALLEEMGVDYSTIINQEVLSTGQNINQHQSQDPGEEEEDWESEIDANPTPSFSLGKGFVESDDCNSSGTGGCEYSDYYQLSIPEDRIYLVDTIPKLKEMLKDLFQDGNVIGFDAEWKPIMCRAGEKEYISILQLAVTGRVYILDMKVLYATKGTEELLKTFFFQFFTNKNVTKVGYGITGDLKIMIGMFSYCKEYVLNSQSLIDLCDLSKKILPHHLIQSELFNTENRGLIDRGLSMLVNRTLGKSLDKTFQVSDWERRPLQRDQLYYAALDAYCLLEVYDRLCYFVQKYDLKLNTREKIKTKWLKTKGTGGHRKDKYEKREHKEKFPIPDNKPLYRGVPRPSTTLKVVCDTMLQGLGRQLRNCGVDTVILEDGQDHTVALQISHKEKRVILTRGKPFFMVRGYVGEDMCMWIPDGTSREQVKMVFTRYHLAVRSKDVLSRCVVCNSNSYTTIPSDEMKIAFELKFDIGESEMPEDQLTASKKINLSNFTLDQNGVEIQMDFMPASRFQQTLRDGGWQKLFHSVEDFYICNSCGKVFWEGSHHKAVKETYADLIDKRETDPSYYGRPG